MSLPRTADDAPTPADHVKGRNAAEIHAAFGAPGDFGRETTIGAALARTYGGRP